MLNKIEKTRLALIKSGKKIINVSSGNPNEHGLFFDQKKLQQISRKYFSAKNTYAPDPKGSIKARQAIQAFYSTRGLAISSEQIIITSGTSESYLYLFKMLASPSEEILFPNPTYPLFEEIARLADIKLSFYKLDEKDGWQPDLKDMEAKISKNTKALVLVSPNNPTGSIIQKNTLLRIVQLAEKYHLPIISDEVFSEFIFDKKSFPKLSKLSKAMPIFTLQGISKTYALPGLKLSWILVHGPHAEKYVNQLERFADALLASNQITQSMLPDLIKQGEKFIGTIKNHVENNRNLAVKMLKECPSISFAKPQGGFYLFAKIHNLKIDDETFVIELMKHTGIFAHPGYFYDYEDGVHILISLLLPPQKLRNCLRKLTDFINALTKF